MYNRSKITPSRYGHATCKHRLLPDGKRDTFAWQHLDALLFETRGSPGLSLPSLSKWAC